MIRELVSQTAFAVIFLATCCVGWLVGFVLFWYAIRPILF